MDRSQLLQILHSRRDAIADNWYQAVSRTGQTSLKAADVRQRLVELTGQIITLLATEPFESNEAQTIGAALAHLHYVQPEVLGRTQKVLARQLLQDLSAEQVVALQIPLAALLSGLATGFFQQARETILVEQEQTHSALVTELRQAEKSLRESEETARALLNAPTDVALLMDSDGIIVALNKAAAKSLGRSASELIGTSAFDLFPPDVAEHRKAQAGQVLRSGKPIRFEDEREGRWFDQSAYPVFDAQGKVVQLAIFARDVTEQKQAEEMLKRRVVQLMLLNNIAEKITAVLELDSMLDRAARVIQESFGYHRVTLFTVDHEQDELVVRALVSDSAASLSPYHRLELNQGIVGWVGYHGETLLANDVNAEPHYVNLGPDAALIRSELCVPIRVGATISGVLDVQSLQLDDFDEHDVMVMEALADQIAVAIENARLYGVIQQELIERKQAEQQAARAGRLAAIGRLAAAMAHEINNPLQAMRSNLELALDFDLEPDEQKKHLHVVHRQIQRLTEITRRVIDFARPADDTRYPISIVRIVQKTLKLVDKQLELARIQTTTDLSAGLPAVFAVPDQITQVLLNLTANAIEAMPNGGHLHIAARADENKVRLTLTNDGPSLSEEHIEHIFDPFFTTKSGGTGLGLSISHSIIHRHNGTIKAENLKDEQGVAFTITLPTTHLVKKTKEKIV